MAGNRKRKRKGRMRPGAVIALAVLAALVILLGQVLVRIRSREIVLNRHVIAEDDIVGVDISHHQGPVDMEALREAGYAFVYIKATEGVGHEDDRFTENWENAARAGIPAGAYHFFSFDSDGAEQAETFIWKVGDDLGGRLIPVVDVELYGDWHDDPPEKEALTGQLRAFVDAVAAAYGTKPMIYTTIGLYRDYLKGEFDDCPYWMACHTYPLTWSFRDDWMLWQYTDRAPFVNADGKDTIIDENVLRRGRTVDDLRAADGRNR